MAGNSRRAILRLKNDPNETRIFPNHYRIFPNETRIFPNHYRISPNETRILNDIWNDFNGIFP
jgi:hypothetical protein